MKLVSTYNSVKIHIHHGQISFAFMKLKIIMDKALEGAFQQFLSDQARINCISVLISITVASVVGTHLKNTPLENGSI